MQYCDDVPLREGEVSWAEVRVRFGTLKVGFGT